MSAGIENAVQEFDEDLLEPYREEGLQVPLIRFTSSAPPHVEIKVGEQEYHYERSFPIKGYSAVMPAYLREQLEGGKKPLIIERSDRFYVYLAA